MQLSILLKAVLIYQDEHRRWHSLLIKYSVVQLFSFHTCVKKISASVLLVSNNLSASLLVVSNDFSASILVVSNNCSWVRNILSHMSIFTYDKHADTLPKLTFQGPTLNIISRKKVEHYQLCRPFPQSRGQLRVGLLPAILCQKKEPFKSRLTC